MKRIESELAQFKGAIGKLRAKGFAVEERDEYGFVMGGETSRSGAKIDLLISALIHGNEVIGIEAINLFLERILAGGRWPSIRIGFVLGNLEAARRGVRFVESDLNRSFLLPHAVTGEQKRAKDVARIVGDAAVVLDLHQTVEPALCPFFILEHKRTLVHLARAIAPELPIVTIASSGFSRTGKTLLECASSGDAMALGVEWGQMGFSGESAGRLCEFLYSATEIIAGDGHRRDGRRAPKGGDAGGGAVAGAERGAAIDVYLLRELILNRNGAELTPGLINFMAIERGDALGHDNDGPLLSPCDGRILFPKYGELARVSHELCVIGVPARLEGSAG